MISGLGAPGGAERVMTGMASFWAGKGRDVAMLTFDVPGVKSFFEIDPAVRIIPLDLFGESRGPLEALRSNFRRVLRIRRAIRSEAPAVIIAFGDMTNIVTIVASAGLGIPVVISERTMPGTFPLRRRWRFLRSVLYRFADAIVVQSSSAAARLAAFRRRIHVIPNPVVRPPAIRSGSARVTGTIMGAGRFTAEKGFKHLIDAYAICKASAAGWSLVIFGDGPLRRELQERVAFHGLEDKIALPGASRDLPAELARADLFVLSSLHEGFPNVLCEAMAAGVPVIATDCPSAVRDIVRPGTDGLLVPPADSRSLAHAIDSLALDPEQRERMGRRCLEITERFSPEVVMGEWDRLLAMLVRKS
ncbi:MAG: glycosyltransferase family 4 protein [Acidobacteria bacterium]|nr:glycosyltransferase family 4 protein [Acidobacteriota bacterium]